MTGDVEHHHLLADGELVATLSNPSAGGHRSRATMKSREFTVS